MGDKPTTLADAFAIDLPKPQSRCFYCGSYSVEAGAYRCTPSCPEAIAASVERERIADAADATCLTCGGLREIDCPQCDSEDPDCDECGGNGSVECPDAPDGCGGTGRGGA